VPTLIFSLGTYGEMISDLFLSFITENMTKALQEASDKLNRETTCHVPQPFGHLAIEVSAAECPSSANLIGVSQIPQPY
jgi:hypothetical protein